MEARSLPGLDHPPALDLRRNERMQGPSGNGARSGVRAGMATEGGDSLESSRRQQDPGGKGWWQVQALPGFHAQVRPRPEKWPPGPGRPCRQGQENAGMRVVLEMLHGFIPVLRGLH